MQRFAKIIAILFSICLNNPGTFSQTPGIKWQRPLGGSANEFIRATITSSDGNIIIVSDTYSNNGDVTGAHGLIDTWVCKLTPEGRILWSHAFGSTDLDHFLNIHNSPDGGYILIMQPGANDGDVIGYKGSADVFVVKLSSEGDILWKRCIGGSSSDNYVGSFVQPDGSTIICGNTFSNDGDFPGNHGSADIFLCKLDNLGNLVIAKAFGGADSEAYQSILVKSNGNFLIFGKTLSNNSGQIGITKGGADIILMEISSNGTFLWCKSYGGSSGENPASMFQVGVNKFSLIAQTASSDGDMTGAHGAADLWVAIVDSMGVIISKQMLGGSSEEDFIAAEYAAADSSILITSLTYSPDGDIDNYHGGSDIWMIKLNNQAAVQWKNTLGGSRNESLVGYRLINNKIFFLANTNSNDGNVSGNHGKHDFWAGLVNESGILNWQKCLGGTEDDVAKAMFVDSSHFLVSGDINSKDGDITGMHARIDTLVGDTSTRIIYYPDVWVASLSISGTLNWQKALGGFDNDQLQNLMLLGDDLYISASTDSKDGDVFKIHGSTDTWEICLAPTNIITGKVFLDKNLNGLMEPGEPYLNDVIIESTKSNYTRSAIPYNGWFKIEVDTGNYTTSVHFALPYYTSVPAGTNNSFSTYFNTDSVSFAVQPIPGKKDLVINAIPLSRALPGFNTTYRLHYKNVGTTTIPSGEIVFKKDSRLTLLSSAPAISSVNGDTLKWNYSNLGPLDTASITLQLSVQASPLVTIGDTLISVAIIAPADGDETPSDDTSLIRHRVSTSFDPNDKYENNGGIISSAQITNGAYLNYTIRFQNTGTDTAFTVVVRDTLDNKLDWASLQMTDASHSYNLSIEDGDKLTWTFFKIDLPDSNINEPASHGFIAYRVLPKSTVVAGDTIHNTASMYFDFNLPVPTNNAFTIIQNNIILPLRLLGFWGFYHDNLTRLQWTSQGEYDFKNFIIQRSLNGTDFKDIGTRLSNGNRSSISNYYFTDDLTAIQNEIIYYRLKMADKDDQIQYSNIISIRRRTGIDPVTIFPNPVMKGMATAMVTSANEALATIKVIDINGKAIWIKEYKLEPGVNSIRLNNLSFYSQGIYTIQVVVGAHITNKQIVIVK